MAAYVPLAGFPIPCFCILPCLGIAEKVSTSDRSDPPIAFISCLPMTSHPSSYRPLYFSMSSGRHAWAGRCEPHRERTDHPPMFLNETGGMVIDCIGVVKTSGSYSYPRKEKSRCSHGLMNWDQRNYLLHGLCHRTDQACCLANYVGRSWGYFGGQMPLAG